MDDPAADDPVVAERGPTRAEREAARAGSVDRDDDAPVEASPSDVVYLTVVSPTGPVTIDLRREGGWPGRALDPVLTIGELVLTRYRHVDAEVLRFEGDDGVVDVDADAWVQWGDDASSRLEVVIVPGAGANDDGSGSVDL
ncbi:MAG: hypothetical protein GWN73_38010 [Actinobacteria bacterium]|nr:hypothetical protein [Actinomycetota bacterium]NIU70854.1 hypothetical protein [Actinomycetota bacterium]